MRRIVRGRSGLLGLITCAGLLGQSAGVEGVVSDSVTHMPLARVHVSLVSTTAGTNLAGTDDAYGAVSDEAGRYAIGNMRPGTFVVRARRAGYVYFDPQNVTATPTLTLKAGEQRVFGMAVVPEASIAGRVTDEFGDPVQGVAVQVVSAPEAQPYGLWTMRAETDDRGEYRISGLPGKFYVEASIPPLQTSGTPEIRSDGSSTSAYATTYYPGALARERGSVVEAVAGRTVTGIDIRVAHRREVKISGTVKGGNATARARVSIRVIHDGGEAEDEMEAGADGSFAFAGLAPGEYRLSAVMPSGGEALRSPVVKVTVENDDAVVTLPLTRGEVMVGSLVVEGVVPVTLTVRLTPEESAAAPVRGGVVAADGGFLLDGVLPGVYRVAVDPLPGNAYIKSVALGGAEVRNGELDLSRGVRGAGLKVTVSGNGGQVSGAIADGGGRRALFVVLTGDVDSFATWKSAIAADASYTFSGIKPGKYRLFSVDPMLFGGLQSYEPLKAIAARATEIEVKEGDRLTRDLTLSGRDAASAK